MRHFAATLLTTALLAVPAIAQQSTVPSPPSATATTAQLAEIRARRQALSRELGSLPPDSPRRQDIKEESARLSEDMRRYAAETTPITVRVPIDPMLIDISSRTPLNLGNEPQSRGGARRTYITHFADTVEADLATRGSQATIGVDAALSLFAIYGPQWEVEEAKAALQSALPAFLQRIRELDEIDANTRTSQQIVRNKDLLARLYRSTVNINWEGGTLGALVKAVRSTVECNVVLAEPSVGALVIPSLSVNRVAPDVFFQSLQSIPLAEDRQLAVTVIAPESKPTDGESSALETLPVIVISERADPRVSSSERRVFDLSGWSGADAAGIKKLIEAINFAMEANGQESQVKVRYHEPSKILFAKGPQDAVALINDIVRAIQSKK
ncbi:MAG: hypothetical protein RIT24_2306 [Planctomycetota bacterium]|jgi:hypothetical protein